MAAYVGSALDVRWIQSAATTVLTGDYRTFTYTPTIDLLDESAGADQTHLYIADLKDGSCAYTSLLQGTSVAGGTIMTATLTEGNVGTLKVSPEGTAAGRTLYTIPAISQGAVLNWQYAALTECNIGWQQNGLRVEGTN